ncbi:uncharacterized protein AMSG_06619 [Thecamonas trahens ATCC 50062]|uniref:Uncharacterized protein n=1 Tax=Thecamonas trahens ATCC 50062 TaxID=461836 RepID=A0A0L0DET2_THETB|nr:hypothetical protein AMSG_06619 [Thecamonas trahens ATCC 50062]KNC50730.1 hypothetical protein AMSG_06619 [Thecamonas trahens ATCC 50062]|eukprot:XP_013756698.1 hypothetical protein AMSG_06619 [Thecamonas trahens ATCC 50062]
MWTASEQLAQYQPAVVWLLYVCGMLVIPLHVWYPWLAEHVQRGYDGPPWFAIALVALWLPAIVSLVAMRAVCIGHANRKAFAQMLVWMLAAISILVAVSWLRVYTWLIVRLGDYRDAPAWHRAVDLRILPSQTGSAELALLALAATVYPLAALGIALLLTAQLRNMWRGVTQIESWELAAATEAAAAMPGCPTPYFPYAAPSGMANLRAVLGPLPLFFPIHLSAPVYGSGVVFTKHPPPSPTHADMYTM